jgi:hypothetical protein
MLFLNLLFVKLNELLFCVLIDRIEINKQSLNDLYENNPSCYASKANAPTLKTYNFMNKTNFAASIPH